MSEALFSPTWYRVPPSCHASAAMSNYIAINIVGRGGMSCRTVRMNDFIDCSQISCTDRRPSIKPMNENAAEENR